MHFEAEFFYLKQRREFRYPGMLHGIQYHMDRDRRTKRRISSEGDGRSHCLRYRPDFFPARSFHSWDDPLQSNPFKREMGLPPSLVYSVTLCVPALHCKYYRIWVNDIEIVLVVDFHRTVQWAMCIVHVMIRSTPLFHGGLTLTQ